MALKGIVARLTGATSFTVSVYGYINRCASPSFLTSLMNISRGVNINLIRNYLPSIIQKTHQLFNKKNVLLIWGRRKRRHSMSKCERNPAKSPGFAAVTFNAVPSKWTTSLVTRKTVLLCNQEHWLLMKCRMLRVHASTVKEDLEPLRLKMLQLLPSEIYWD